MYINNTERDINMNNESVLNVNFNDLIAQYDALKEENKRLKNENKILKDKLISISRKLNTRVSSDFEQVNFGD